MRILCYNTLSLQTESYRMYHMKHALRSIGYHLRGLRHAIADFCRATRFPKRVSTGD